MPSDPREYISECSHTRSSMSALVPASSEGPAELDPGHLPHEHGMDPADGKAHRARPAMSSIASGWSVTIVSPVMPLSAQAR